MKKYSNKPNVLFDIILVIIIMLGGQSLKAYFCSQSMPDIQDVIIYTICAIVLVPLIHLVLGKLFPGRH